ncbi:MAG: DUF4032 domain-containing protein [Acidimicrobiia bacterium]
MGTPHLQVRPGNPDFLDLPWADPVEAWQSERLVDMPTGMHRHPVVFVAYDEGVYAIKELPRRLAEAEFSVLRSLEERTGLAATPAGLVSRDWLESGAEQGGAVITRYVEHSFPYRHLVSGPGFGRRRGQMLDAIAGLLVDLHLAGCFWGDCSLSNVLYRYDAGAIEAIMIDAETSELHPGLSEGQRLQDLEIMKENLAGEMADIAAEHDLEIDAADLGLGEGVEERYDSLWRELNEDLVISANERYRIRQRIARLNELGFSVGDVDLAPVGEDDRVRMRVRVGGRTFHSQRLGELTGIEASENQARHILSDLNYFIAKSGKTSSTGKTVAVMSWLTTCYEPLLARISQVWKGNPIQGFCDLLQFRLTVAGARGADVPNDEAFLLWSEAGFPGFAVR